MLKIYSNCIDGQADAACRRITDALGAQHPEPDPATTTASRLPEMQVGAAQATSSRSAHRSRPRRPCLSVRHTARAMRRADIWRTALPRGRRGYDELASYLKGKRLL